MEIFGKYIFPLLLILGSLYLALRERVLYINLVKAGAVDKRATLRMMRRIFSAFLIIIMAIMIAYGLTYNATPTKETFHAQLNYWVIVIGIAFTAMMLALWDVYDGIKNIEKMVDQSSKESLKEIQNSLRNSGSKGVQL